MDYSEQREINLSHYCIANPAHYQWLAKKQIEHSFLLQASSTVRIRTLTPAYCSVQSKDSGLSNTLMDVQPIYYFFFNVI